MLHGILLFTRVSHAVGFEKGFSAARTPVEKEIVMKKLVALIVLLSIGVLTGCNTIEGAGKDIERGGEKVQDTAKDVKQKM
jgi:entericidin B